MEGYRLLKLSARRIAIGRMADESLDAWRLLEAIPFPFNETWARRALITPSHEMHSKPPELEIYKRLPRTNFKLCGEQTCTGIRGEIVDG